MLKPSFTRFAVAGAVMVALMLTGCGRKGALDLPPSASAAPPGPAPETDEPPQGVTVQPPPDTASNPVAVPGRKRSLPMDVLLN